jgi:hypothetical protein
MIVRFIDLLVYVCHIKEPASNYEALRAKTISSNCKFEVTNFAVVMLQVSLLIPSVFPPDLGQECVADEPGHFHDPNTNKINA